MTLREALKALYEEHGVLTPALVVEVARDGDGAVAECLHESLTWDDGEAAERYRLLEAAKLIRRFKVVYRPTPRSGLREARAFVSVPSPEGPSYHPIERVAEDPLMSRLMLQEAERAWRDLKARYSGLHGFVEMIRRDLDSEDLAA
jgi:hypothetical protein